MQDEAQLEWLASAKQLHQRGDLAGASQYYQRILQMQPEHSEAWMLLGLSAYQNKDYPVSESLFKKALSIDNNVAATWCNYGSLLQHTQRVDEAVGAFKSAIKLQPVFPEAYANLGNAYAAKGELESALKAYQKATLQKPDYVDAHINIGISYREMGRFEMAETYFLQLVDSYPDSAEVVHNLGSLYAEMGRASIAAQLFERAIAMKPDYAEAYSNLGAHFLEMGDHEKAMACFDKAPSYAPQFHIVESNKLFALHYDPEISSQALYDAAMHWGAKHAPVSMMQPPITDKNPDKVLRVGYVSADIRTHPIGFFLESVLASHTGAVEVFCYANMPHEDHQTKRIKPSVKHWRRIFGKSDDEVERIIREDKIDILLDMSGHTAANRLMVFARKPAPIQITWLGYFDTTGMPAMDYILCDDKVLPKVSEKWYLEKPLRMPTTYLCFAPPPYDISSTITPSQNNGFITFGCFNRLNKLTPQVLSCWADILHAVDSSVLLLKSKSFAESTICDGFRDIFKQHGINPNRIHFDIASLRRDYLAQYKMVDIVLDPFPYGGGTTTAEALWMGRPVVTWPQERFISRLSCSLLGAMKRDEWVANSQKSYIDIAAKLAQNSDALTKAHNTVREQFLLSPVCDEKRFVKDLEHLYRIAWRKYCEA